MSLTSLFSDPVPDRQHPAQTLYLTFQSGGATLHGRLFAAQGAGQHPTVLLLHGYPGIEQNYDLAYALRRCGWHVIMFHYRGAWGSGGSFSVAHALEDTLNVLEQIAEPSFAVHYDIDLSQLFLVGHSMGGFIALMTTAHSTLAMGAVGMATFNFGAYARYIQPDDIDDEAALWNMEAAPLNGASGHALVQEILQHGSAWDLVTLGESLASRPVMLVGGTQDFVASNALHLWPTADAYRLAGVPVHTWECDGDHSLSGVRIALTRQIVEWLESQRRV